MYGMANFLENAVLNAIFRTAAFTKPAQIVLELLKTLPTDDAGTGLAAADFTGYASVDLGAPADADWSNPTAGTQGEVDNVAEASFGTNTGALQRVIGVAIYNETAKTNLLFVQALANNWRGADINLTGDVFTSQSHGLSNNDRVFLRGLVGGTGLDEQTEYHVVGATTDTFQVSLTQGGAAVTITADGYCEVGDSQAKDIATNDEAKIAAGALNISLD